MIFAIQVCNPSLLSTANVTVEDVAEAIQNIFPLDNESAFLIWNGIPVRIDYKYDLSIMIDDALYLLSKMVGVESGIYDVKWRSDTFFVDWDIVWNENDINIKSHWYSISGGYEDAINARSEIRIDKKTFTHSWKLILQKTIECIRESGIKIRNHNNFQLLIDIEALL